MTHDLTQLFISVLLWSALIVPICCFVMFMHNVCGEFQTCTYLRRKTLFNVTIKFDNYYFEVYGLCIPCVRIE